VYAYPVKLLSNTFAICSEPLAPVYSTSATFTPGITLYYESYLTNPVSGYDYVVDATGSLNIYNLNNVTGVVGADTTLDCSSCSEFYVVPSAGELSASDDGFIYFQFTSCYGVPTTTSLNSPATFCVQSPFSIFLFYYLGGNPTQCITSTYTNTSVPC
jgi:hypothetical protein